MSKKSIKKSLERGAFLIEKTINVFSEEALKDEYFYLLKNVFGLSDLAVKVYLYAQNAERLDDYVILKEQDIAAALRIKNTDKITKAIKELLNTELMTTAPTAQLYCLLLDKPFNEKKHDEILLTISIKKVDALKEDVEPEPIKAAKSSHKFVDLKEYLKHDFGYTDEELKEVESAFGNDGITQEKFFEKIKEWKKGMRTDISPSQQRNYLSACLMNEEWQ